MLQGVQVCTQRASLSHGAEDNVLMLITPRAIVMQKDAVKPTKLGIKMIKHSACLCVQLSGGFCTDA